MRSICVAILAVFVVFIVGKNGQMTTSSSMNEVTPKAETTAQGTSPGGPVSYAPFKQSFTTTEGDPFLIAADVDCPSTTPTDNEFELLPPTPSFVHLSPIYINTKVPRVATIIAVNPQPGDAGKYEIKVRATPCYGSLGSILSFKLKVKKAGGK